MNGYTKIHASPVRFFLITGLAIFLIDLGVAAFLVFYPHLKGYEAIMDAVILTALVSPLLYFNLLRPMRIQIEERALVEEQLRKSGKTLEDIFSVNYMLIAYLDARFNFIRVNQAYASADGRPPEFFVGKNHFDLYPHQENQALFQQVVDTGEPCYIFDKPFEYPEDPSRGVSYWNWSLLPIKDAQDRVTELVFTLVDVTRQHHTEMALQDRERKFRAIFNQTFEFIGLLSPSGETIEINQTALDYIALRLEDCAGRPFWELPFWDVPDANHERIHQAINQAAQGKFVRFEIDMCGAQGAFIAIDFSLKPVTDDLGQVVFLIPEGRDVTNHKRMEGQLMRKNLELQVISNQERSQRQFTEGLTKAALALNTSLDLVTVLDRILEQAFRVIPCRAALILIKEGTSVRIARHRGLETLPETSSKLDSIFDLADIPFMASLEATRQTYLDSDTGDLPGKSFLPGLVWVKSYAAAPLQSNDELIGAIVLISEEPYFFKQDSVPLLAAFAAHAEIAAHNARLFLSIQEALSHEQELRSQLVQQEKFAAMGRLLASVSHELNNPIQTIKNCLFLAREDTPADSPVQEYLDISSSETERIARLVSQLREIYRPRANLPFEPLRLSNLLADIQILLESLMRSRQVRWCYQAQTSNDLVAGSVDQLKQVFINICTNAVEAMSNEGGELLVILKTAENQAGVEIHDQGAGIQPENISRLFEPFFTTKARGVGLGLPICYEIIQRHHGRIDVDSQPGAGTSFTVWLPLLQEIIS